MNQPSDRKTLLTLLGAVVVFSALAAVVGLWTYRLGQESAPAPTAQIAAVAPTAAPPQIVTNTPTATATPSPTATVTPTPTASPTNTPTPSPTPIVVITHVNKLGRLETTEFAMRTVVDLENDRSNLWQKIFGSDQLLLLAEGEVVAGFDLEKVTEGDIQVDGTRVVLTLPAPEILYSRVDNERTQVYERNTGLFLKPDPTLEGRARQLAEESMRQWALERGILDKATATGRQQLENLLRSLGFTEIIINVRVKPI
ncbi:MAG: hypothetical protein FOGNACKC_03519 [Anaerolineae bacterium]|nr:hypothetical protein [Anaerolineae bacterium]